MKTTTKLKLMKIFQPATVGLFALSTALHFHASGLSVWNLIGAAATAFFFWLYYLNGPRPLSMQEWMDAYNDEIVEALARDDSCTLQGDLLTQLTWHQRRYAAYLDDWYAAQEGRRPLMARDWTLANKTRLRELLLSKPAADAQHWLKKEYEAYLRDFEPVQEAEEA